MRVTRTIAGATAALTAVLGLSLATAGSASAAGGGSWHAYGNTNPITSSSSTWVCGTTKTVASEVGAQVCAIRAPGGGAVQGAVIVRNNRSSAYSTSAEVTLHDWSADVTWGCASSGVAANSWSVCFSPTVADDYYVYASGYANGVALPASGDA
ncbi:hypothetical protein [Streptomyces sp. NPDC020983]|uniref:hypothetical protein n=1 Tax=Streptomyces sp. NPDC020983 TaxID=3365106 RepID=UPI0037A2D8BA